MSVNATAQKTDTDESTITLDPKLLSGYKTVEKFRKLIDKKLKARIDSQIHPSEQDVRRKFTAHNYFTLLLFGLYNPVLKSMRALVAACEFEKVQQELDIGEISLGSFSESQHIFDPELLREVFQDLSKHIAFKPKLSDPRLEVFIEKMIAVDGSLFDALPRMTWAVYKPKSGNHKIKLHLAFEALRGGIADAEITAGNACERKALKKMIAKGKLYVGDRYYGLEYAYFECFEQKDADFIMRIRNNSQYSVVESRELTEPSKDYGVLSDEIIRFDNEDKGTQWRLVRIERDGHTFMLLTNRLDIEAQVVGMLYRHRWEVELFFKWLKCILGCHHLILESPKGVSAQIYTALILALLLSALTGKKPNKRQMEAIQLHLLGFVSDEELEKVLLPQKSV